MIVESLPRTESSLLSVKLSTLFLRDLTTQGTIFPVLVSPKTVSSDEERHGGSFSIRKIRSKTDSQLYIIDFTFSRVFHRHRFLNAISYVAGQSCCCQS